MAQGTLPMSEKGPCPEIPPGKDGTTWAVWSTGDGLWSPNFWSISGGRKKKFGGGSCLGHVQ